MRANGRTTAAAARRYTAGRRSVRLVYQEAFRSVGKALAREYVVKYTWLARRRMRWSSARDDATTETALPEAMCSELLRPCCSHGRLGPQLS